MTTHTGSLVAETLLQDTHITSEPKVAPSTAADKVERVSVHDDDIDDSDNEDAHSYSSSIIKPLPRSRQPMPSLPDLRFEQSYLASIQAAKGSWWKIIAITVKDQVFFPFMQGIAFNVAWFGWRRFNRQTKLYGSGMGARVRRWWWRTNNWELPADLRGA